MAARDAQTGGPLWLIMSVIVQILMCNIAIFLDRYQYVTTYSLLMDLEQIV